MSRERPPLFLERSSYRKRRKMDALKMLVFLGVILWLIPLSWPSASDGAVDGLTMSRALFYVFGVWIALIILSAFLTRGLGETDDSDPASDQIQ